MTVKKLKDLITDMNKVNFIDIVSGKQVSLTEVESDENFEKLEIIKLQPSSNIATYYDGYTPMLNVYIDLGRKTLTLRELIDTMKLPLCNRKWVIRASNSNKILYTNNELLGGSNVLFEDIRDLPKNVMYDMVVRYIDITNLGNIEITVMKKEH